MFFYKNFRVLNLKKLSQQYKITALSYISMLKIMQLQIPITINVFLEQKIYFLILFSAIAIIIVIIAPIILVHIIIYYLKVQQSVYYFWVDIVSITTSIMSLTASKIFIKSMIFKF
jgi:hypothetical protein